MYSYKISKNSFLILLNLTNINLFNNRKSFFCSRSKKFSFSKDLFKRNMLFFTDYINFFKLFNNFLRPLKLKNIKLDFNYIFNFKILYNKDYSLRFNRMQNFKPTFFFLSGKNDFWYASVFDSFCSKSSAYHLSWNSSKFFFIFQRLKETFREFFPIFLISPILMQDTIYQENKFLFASYLHFAFVTNNSYYEFISHNKFINNQIFPLLIDKNNKLVFIIFWFNLLKKLLNI
jgi:hypothetical protein